MTGVKTKDCANEVPVDPDLVALVDNSGTQDLHESQEADSIDTNTGADVLVVGHHQLMRLSLADTAASVSFEFHTVVVLAVPQYFYQCACD